MNMIKEQVSFEALSLSQPILKALNQLGFEQPTPIQQITISKLQEGDTDLIGLAQTGTGKTAAFGIPMLERIDPNYSGTQALVVCPTRELCLQISSDFAKYSAFMQGIRTVAIYGGASLDQQAKEISRGAHIVVATPGRLVDMIHRKRVRLGEVKIVVLDEADEMLNMGFKEDLDFILSETPSEKNTWLFSATMPQEVYRIAKNYMHNPVEVSSGKVNISADNIEHHFYVIHAKDRYAALRRIADYYPEMYGMVFCRTRAETHEVAHHLVKDGYNADALHGDLSQQQRDQVMHKFRNRQLNMLVATDVAARGIDVKDISHVIHYQLPDELENYTHRSGRTARAGKSGISIALVNTRESGKIRDLERQLKKTFHRKDIPSGEDIVRRQIMHTVEQIRHTDPGGEEMDFFLDEVAHRLEGFSKEELIRRILFAEFNRFNQAYKNSVDLNFKHRERDDHGERNDRRDRKDRNDYRQGRNDREDRGSSNSRSEMKSGRYFINVGTMDGFDHENFRQWVKECTGVSEHDLRRINMKDQFTFFETDPDLSPMITEGLLGRKWQGRKLRFDNGEGNSGGGESPKSKSKRFDNKSGSGRNNQRGDRGRKEGGFREKSKSGGSREPKRKSGW